MSACERLLSRLDGVRGSGQYRWMAKCPAHEDRTASLSIRDADGRVLICCHAGCSAGDVVTATGLSLSDLFDAPLAHSVARVRDPMRPRIDAAELLAGIRHEAMVVVIIAERLARNEPLAPEDHRRLIRATTAITAAVTKSIQAEPPELRRLRRGESQVCK
jgi:hypothetical protein